MTRPAVLEIRDLRTYFYSRAKEAFIRSVDGVSLAVAAGETLGVVGESGSGKSVTALSILSLVGGSPGVITGTIEFAGATGAGTARRNLLEDLGRYVRVSERDGRIVAVTKDESGWRARVERVLTGVRGKEIAMIFQNPKSSLNPFLTVGQQISEAIRLHTPVDRKSTRLNSSH